MADTKPFYALGPGPLALVEVYQNEGIFPSLNQENRTGKASLVIPNNIFNSNVKITTSNIFNVTGVDALVNPTDRFISGASGISYELFIRYYTDFATDLTGFQHQGNTVNPDITGDTVDDVNPFLQRCRRSVGPSGLNPGQANIVQLPPVHVQSPSTPQLDAPGSTPKFVINVADPENSDPSYSNSDQSRFYKELGKCYTNALRCATAAGLKSIVIPAIGTGARRANPRRATETALRAIRSFLEESYLERRQNDNANTIDDNDDDAWVMIDSDSAPYQPIQIILAIPSSGRIQASYINCLQLYFPPVFPTIGALNASYAGGCMLTIPSLLSRSNHTHFPDFNVLLHHIEFDFPNHVQSSSICPCRISTSYEQAKVCAAVLKLFNQLDLVQTALVVIAEIYSNINHDSINHRQRKILQELYAQYNMLALSVVTTQRDPDFEPFWDTYNSCGQPVYSDDSKPQFEDLQDNDNPHVKVKDELGQDSPKIKSEPSSVIGAVKVEHSANIPTCSVCHSALNSILPHTQSLTEQHVEAAEQILKLRTSRLREQLDRLSSHPKLEPSTAHHGPEGGSHTIINPLRDLKIV